LLPFSSALCCECFFLMREVLPMPSALLPLAAALPHGVATAPASLVLDGEKLTIESLWHACQLAEVPQPLLSLSFASQAEAAVAKGADFLHRLAASGDTVYGINTGFGFFAKTRIAREQTEELQRNIILSHACGVGELLPRSTVLAMWLILMNSLCRGRRGLSPEHARHILRTLEAGLLADVPSRGSVGASGDLAPTAHAVMALLGEGNCTLPVEGEIHRLPAAEALQRLGLAPMVLGPKEGLCLINGTQLTAAFAVQAWMETRQLLHTANLACALMTEAIRGSHKAFTPELLREQRHGGTLACGAEIANWLGGDTEVSLSHRGCDRVQDPYSLRCAPQVHGMVWDELQHTRTVIEAEINSTTDNPILFPETEEVLHGGNFHAIYPARVCDRLAAAVATLAAISERRIAMAMKQEKSGLPNFLTRQGGLHSGFMMLQTTAAALASECKTLSFPASVDTIPTNNDQEDHVSMGPIAGLKALKVLKLARYVLAIELLASAQGLDLLAPLRTSERLERAKGKIRELSPFLAEDRYLTPDMEAVADAILKGFFAE
jgi:histidine ammonia-lyase